MGRGKGVISVVRKLLTPSLHWLRERHLEPHYVALIDSHSELNSGQVVYSKQGNTLLCAAVSQASEAFVDIVIERFPC